VRVFVRKDLVFIFKKEEGIYRLYIKESEGRENRRDYSSYEWLYKYYRSRRGYNYIFSKDINTISSNDYYFVDYFTSFED